ncbi:MAG: hypothetical protein HKN72_13845 [Gemmatimonadetes bacterium]|nr:hypothetical protein [Gemmatimonadota bacterium]
MPLLDLALTAPVVLNFTHEECEVLLQLIIVDERDVSSAHQIVVRGGQRLVGRKGKCLPGE